MSSPATALVSVKTPSTDFELSIQQRDHAVLAYVLWQRRGCPQGSPEEDWFGAERIRQDEELAKFTGS
jgi:hypothetical protein